MQRSQMYFHANVILVAVYISSQNQEKSTYISFFSQSIFTEFHNAEITNFHWELLDYLQVHISEWSWKVI